MKKNSQLNIWPLIAVGAIAGMTIRTFVDNIWVGSLLMGIVMGVYGLIWQKRDDKKED